MSVRYDPARVAAAFNRLFQTYPSFQAGEAADDALRVYFEAVEDYQTIDIEGAVKNFLAGVAPGVNPSFAPPAPALASEVRRVMNLRLDSEARTKAARPVLPPPDVERTPESIARVRAMVADLVPKLRTKDAADEVRKAAEQKKWQERMDARFIPDQSPEAMKSRLHIGDPEGDRDVA